MDIATLTQMVGSLGFPIVCCGYMMLVNNKTIKENTDATNKMISLLERLVETHE